ncbi:hypothetical protein GGR52DRAFT_105269 [Hypoxylon sp. FL1284]|nr:hypothetical protein GGR52DRAFT_105269 [Hypoxylon sp. FL1284]
MQEANVTDHLDSDELRSATESTASNGSTLTPTHSVSMSDGLQEDTPWPGNTYIIRDPDTERQITLLRGELCLAEHQGNQGGYYWKCIEKDGWLGFRSPTDHLHIGHDNRRNFIASAKQHRNWEYFNTRQHPKGGHVLMVVHGWQQTKMAISEDGCRLVETMGDGTAWQFVKVPSRGAESVNCAPQ